MILLIVSTFLLTLIYKVNNKCYQRPLSISYLFTNDNKADKYFKQNLHIFIFSKKQINADNKVYIGWFKWEIEYLCEEIDWKIQYIDWFLRVLKS